MGMRGSECKRSAIGLPSLWRAWRRDSSNTTVVDIFPQKVCYSDSILSETGICRGKSEHPSRPLKHRKSDSYAAPTAQRRSAGAGISDPEGSGPSPGCRPQAFPDSLKIGGASVGPMPCSKMSAVESTFWWARVGRRIMRAGHASISTLDVRTGRLQWGTAVHWREHHKIKYKLEASLRQVRPRRLGGCHLPASRLPPH
jgi:hypothetical protein